MNKQAIIPDAETRKREIEQIRAANRQLEEASLALGKRLQAKSQVKSQTI